MGEEVAEDSVAIETDHLLKRTMADTLDLNTERRSQEVNLKEVMTKNKIASKMHIQSPQEVVAKLLAEPTSRPKGAEKRLWLSTRMISQHCDESADIIRLSSGRYL